MSRQEKLVIIFLLVCAAVGIGVSFYKKAHPPAIQVIPSSIGIAKGPAYIKVKININTADQQELASLRGIGPSLAGEIIDYRRENSPFLSPEDIMKVTGIGKAKYEAIKDFIVVEDEPRSSFERNKAKEGQ